MPTSCRICGRPVEEGGDICEICQESIRAEAMGRQRRIAKEAPPGEAGKLRLREKKGVIDKTSPLAPHDEEGEKKPHHFKSMAEYLEYLKKK